MTDKSGSSLPTREKARRGNRAMMRSSFLHSTILLLCPAPEMGLAILEPVEGATEAGATTPPKEGPPMFAAGVLDWSQPDNVAAPNALGTGEPPTEPARRAEAGQAFGGGPMSERPEIPSLFGEPEGRALIGGGKEGAQVAPLDEPPP